MGGNRKQNEELIAKIILDNVCCDNCSRLSNDNLNQPSIAQAAKEILAALRMTPDNIMKQPTNAAVVSKTGQERLQRIVKQCEWLENRIRAAHPAKEMSYDAQELSALRWMIGIIEQVGSIEEEVTVG